MEILFLVLMWICIVIALIGLLFLYIAISSEIPIFVAFFIWVIAVFTYLAFICWRKSRPAPSSENANHNTQKQFTLPTFSNEYKTHLLEWQKFVSENSPDSLIMNQQQLTQITNVQKANDVRIINDCINLIASTTNPDTFFTRFDLLEERLEHLDRLNDFLDPQKTQYREFDINIPNYKARATRDFIERYARSVSLKMDSLKTVKGKSNQVQKYIDSMEPYYSQLDSKSINYIQKQRNILLTKLD